MLGRNLSLDSLSKGYITEREIDFIRSFMWDTTGSILEVGAYVGKTFNHLHKYRPNWDYVGVDTWELFPVPLCDPEEGHDPANFDMPMLHSKYFKENCPFSNYFVDKYENFNFEKNSFDIIILSAIAPEDKLNIRLHYKKAVDEIKEDGIIIGRFLNHPLFGKGIRESLDILNLENFIEDESGGVFAIW